MYIPADFMETDENVIQAFIAENPFATLVSGDGSNLKISHVPMYFIEEGGKRFLVGHLAKANDHCRYLDSPCTAIFHGPHAYISSKWYEARNVVPTWNYVVVHVSGILSGCDGSDLSKTLELMTKLHEGDPHEFNQSLDEKVRSALEKHIVGVKLEIEKIEGKWKLSQNKTAEIRGKIAANLSKINDPGSKQIAGLMMKNIEKSPKDRNF